ncbi:class I SAM-dependent methyltransferase, partial [Kitasatospora albolonga]
PEVVQAPTSVLADGRIPAGSCRFVHVDASHLYEHVAGDIQVARAALAPDGLLVLDDYRSEHCPGVGAAIWEAVFDHGLKPALLTECKFYGTWGDPTALQEELLAVGGGAEGCWLNVDTIGGHRVLRLDGKPTRPTAFPRPRNAPPAPDPKAVEAAAAAEAAAASALRAAQDLAERRARAAAARRPAAVARQMAADLLPPVVAAAIRRARHRG